MPFSHLILVVLVAVIWGINFLFVKLGVEEIPPLLLCAVRFMLASVPAVFFIKPPHASFKLVATYGLVMFALQFGLIFVGMHLGMTAGMAALIMQVQIFFSLFFAVIWLKETPSIWQMIGALISFVGIGIAALHFDQDISFLGFVFVLAAAAAWGAGNLLTKKMSQVNMIALVVWGSFAACWPMLLLSLLFEGPAQISHSYQQLSWQGISAVLYITYASTWLGYGLWNWLLGRYPVGVVAPFTLLVPIVGLFSSVVVLGEPLQLWKWAAAIFVIAGLCVNLLGERWFSLKTQPKVQPELRSEPG